MQPLLKSYDRRIVWRKTKQYGSYALIGVAVIFILLLIRRRVRSTLRKSRVAQMDAMPPRKRAAIKSRILKWGAVFGISAIGLICATPSFLRARSVARMNSCICNLRIIDGAKQQWALERKKTGEDVPTWRNLEPYMGAMVGCPDGGIYTLNRVAEAPACTFPQHALP